MDHTRSISRVWTKVITLACVNVRKFPRCSPLTPVSDGYYMCHTSFDMRKGTVCRFGCYEGHTLVGASSIKCTADGTWTAVQPKCERIACEPKLLAPQGTTLHCTDSNYFRSKCTYVCEKGFDITPGMTRFRVCSANGKWRGREPKCTDILPPVITNCTGVVYGFADRGGTTGRLNWPEPSVHDNADSKIKLQQNTGPNRSARLRSGTYDVIYDAEDSAGNKALRCKMKAVMKVLKCPKIYSLPHQTVVCIDGSKYGSQCQFQCANGSLINGTESASCEKDSRDGQYVSWKWGPHQPFCQAVQLCEDSLDPPDDGAVACDYWLGGKFCQMLCRKGFDVPIGYTFEEMYVCVESGKWWPDNKLPNCAKTIGSHTAAMSMTVKYYFDGDCNDAAVLEHIKIQFIEALNQSAVNAACRVYADKCIPGNVQVRCGRMTTKRSARPELTINVEMEIGMRSSFANMSFARLNEDMKVWTANIRNMTMSGVFDLTLGGNVTLNAQGFTNDNLRIVCDGQSIPSYPTESCVECPPGTFYDQEKQACPLCSAGHYQPLSAQTKCIPCPTGKSTSRKGATYVDDCEDACEPGTFSTNGLPPCSLCLAGTYEDSYGSTECSVCSRSSTTIAEGTIAVNDCHDFDMVISSSVGRATLPLINDSISTLQTFVISFWIQAKTQPSFGSIIRLDNPDQNDYFDIGVYGSILHFEKNGINVTTMLNINDTRWHYMVVDVGTSSIAFYLDAQRIQLQHHKYNARSSVGSLDAQLIISDGDFIGSISQLNVWSHNNQPETIPPRCHSTSRQGDAVSWKEFESIDEDHVFLQIPSECDDHDDCSSNPCNDGLCKDGLHTYSCECPIGLKGDNCEYNTDDCVDNVCENNSTCVDGVADYTCQCDVNYTGDLCEIAIVDGEWSDWGNWSVCSTTCGEGTTSRRRLCNSPTPDNGGQDCPGRHIEHSTCNLENCTVCTNITTPAHAILVCNRDTSEDAINCTLACEDGYDFDHPAKEDYTCGPDTFQLWDFQTDDNPYGRLPDCTKRTESERIEWKYRASYKDLVCDTKDNSEFIVRKIKKAVYEGTESLTCQRDGTCSLINIKVTDCQSNRLRRSVDPTTAGFAADFTCDATKFTSDGCRDVVSKALEEMLVKVGGDSFNTIFNGLEYSIKENSSTFGGKVYCKAGMVPVRQYCVPCSVGRFLSSGECKKCSLGTYQNQIGQTSCVSCPKGSTTEGRASNSVDDCNVYVKIHHDTVPAWKYGVPIGLGLGFVVVFLLVVRHLSKLKRERKIESIYKQYGDQRSTSVSKPKFMSQPQQQTSQ